MENATALEESFVDAPTIVTTTLTTTHAGYQPPQDALAEIKRRFPSGKQAFLWEDEWPVYKFGYDKFCGVRLDKASRHELQFVFGDFTQVQSKWVPGDKSICLNSLQMTKLCGMLLNNFLDLCKDPSNRDLSGRLSPMYALGDSVYFVWSTIGESPIANVRLFSMSGYGDLRPTMTGMSVGLKSFESLRTMVKDLALFRAAKMVYEKRDKCQDVFLPVPNMTKVRVALPYIMWHKYLNILRENCSRCNDLRMVFGHPFRREASHTCNWGEKDLQLTDEHFSQIKHDLEFEKRIFAMMVQLRPWGDRTSLVNCLDFDTDHYFAGIERSLWKDVVTVGNREMIGLKVVATGVMAPEVEPTAFPFPPIAGPFTPPAPQSAAAPPVAGSSKTSGLTVQIPEGTPAPTKGKKSSTDQEDRAPAATEPAKKTKKRKSPTTRQATRPSQFPDHWDEDAPFDSDAIF